MSANLHSLEGDMGNAKFFYYPKPSITSYLETIDLGEPLVELFSDYEIDAQDGVSYTGRRYRTVSRISEVVRIQRDRMIDGENKSADLITLQSHLDRGHSTLFTSDTSKAYATFLKCLISAELRRASLSLLAHFKTTRGKPRPEHDYK